MGGKCTFALLFALLLAAASFAASCAPAVKTANLAAVLADGKGAVVPLEVELKPGSGQVYTSIEPKTGMGTQDSQQAAVKFAFGGGNGGCDVYFRIKASDGTAYVDGPSAGAAMALAIRAALTNNTVRNDIVITGTISEDGKIGDVGGIVEKAVASAKAGKTGILTPRQQVYEHIVLSTLKRDYNFTARSVETFEEASAIAYAKPSSRIEEKFGIKSEPLPANLQPVEKDDDLQTFSIIASSVIGKVRQDVAQAGAGGPEGDLAEFKNYIGEEAGKYEKLNEMGYVYTSANGAFLLGIESEFLKVGSRDIDMQGSRSDVEACLASVRIPQKTDANFYWVVGAGLRKAWGERKLADTQELMNEVELKYPVLHEMLFAQSWCTVASQLAVARVGGKAVDEAKLEGLAQEKIRQAQEQLNSSEPDSDAKWHLEIAQDSFSKGQYAQAAFDAVYAKTMVQAKEELMQDAPKARETAGALVQENKSSLWGKIYSGQAKYIYAQDPKSMDAYRLLRFSGEIDRLSAQMDEQLAGKADVQQEGENAWDENAQAQKTYGKSGSEYAKNDLVYAIGLLALVWIFGACIIVEAWKGRKTAKRW